MDPMEEPPDWQLWSLMVALLQLQLELLQYFHL